MRRTSVPPALRRASLALPLILALASAACSRERGTYDAPSPSALLPARAPATAMTDEAKSTVATDALAGGAAPGAPASEPVANVPPASAGRMLIRNVSLSIVVADVDSAAARVERLVAARGGFVASSNLEDRGGFAFRSYTLRVPADRLDPTLAELRRLAVKVTGESQNVQDVTDQAVDVQARLRTLRTTEEELIGLLKDARARGQKVDDVMAIYRELTGIRTQIEQYAGQLESLRNQSALSTISLTLSPDAATAPIQPQGWRPGETVKNSLRQLVGALRGLGDFAIWALLVLVPIGALVAAAVAGLVALAKRAGLRAPWRRRD